MAVPFLRSAFNYDRNAASDESGLLCRDLSLAQQHQRDESDINTIVKRFGLTGQLPVGVRVPSFGDFSGISDFHEALTVVAEAREGFEKMPADVRARFHNDPGEFMDFVHDDKNREEAVKLGLVLPAVVALTSSSVSNVSVKAPEERGGSPGEPSKVVSKPD